MAEVEELGVSVFEELNGGLRPCGGVVEEGGVPADDGEVVGVVGDARLEDFVALDSARRPVSPRTIWVMWRAWC